MDDAIDEVQAQKTNSQFSSGHLSLGKSVVKLIRNIKNKIFRDLERTMAHTRIRHQVEQHCTWIANMALLLVMSSFSFSFFHIICAKLCLIIKLLIS